MLLMTPGNGEGIQGSTLNRWFGETNRERTFVIVDGYTEDTNLDAYYGIRETLGTAALNVIQSAEKTTPTAPPSETLRRARRRYDGFRR